MKTGNIVLGALAGTTAMTLYSYLASKDKKRNFKEPELLGKMVKRAVPAAHKDHAEVAGWMLHYATGLTFAALYDKLIRKTGTRPTVPYGILVGGLTGLAAVGIWDATFRVHPNPPKTHFERYYGHLLVTHLVFGAFTFLGYRLASAIDQRKAEKNITTEDLSQTSS